MAPAQIAGRHTRTGDPIRHETIYRYIHQDKKQGGTLFHLLRHAGKPNNKRISKKSGRGYIPPRVDISQRPSGCRQTIEPLL